MGGGVGGERPPAILVGTESCEIYTTYKYYISWQISLYNNMELCNCREAGSAADYCSFKMYEIIARQVIL